MAAIIGISIAVIIIYYTGKKRPLSPDKIKTKAKFAICLYLIFACIVYAIDIVKAQYINSAVTHFHQLVAIVSPYIEDIEKEKYHSRFAQIQSMEDYSKLISEFKSIALKNKQTVPKFDIW